MSQMTAEQLTNCYHFRNERGWCLVKSVTFTRNHAIVTTDRGRFVMPKAEKVEAKVFAS